MQLSVVILNYNVSRFLEQCILSVQKAILTIDAEIIVVDNNSSDDSCAMVREKFPDITLIVNPENYGFPKGNNIGVAIAKGKYVCILNPDTVVAEDTFAKILASSFLANDTEFGIVGCKLIDGTGHFLPESKRGIPTPWVAVTKIFGLYRLFPKMTWFNQYYAQHLPENQSGRVAILVGAFMVLRKELYEEIGGFDENCFMYSDDIDLSYRVLQKGKSNYYFADTTIIHYKGESTVRDQKYVRRFQEAMQYFYKKHFGGSLFFTLIMQVGALFFSILKSKQQKNKSVYVQKRYMISKENRFPKELKLDVLLSNLSDFVNDSDQNIEVSIDTSFFSYQEIITFMEKNKAKNVFFKNYYPNSSFSIGSNHANDIGQVINFTKNDAFVM